MADKAITLVEMVIGLAITAVLAATTLVSFNFVDGRRLDTQARNMVSDLSWLRELAVASHKDYTVVFDANNDSYSLYRDTVSAANLVRKQKLNVNLTVITDWQNNAITQFTFLFPKGSTTTSALITLNQTGRSRVINVGNQTGFVSME
jgi:Tfp pilus assembly protein PilE